MLHAELAPQSAKSRPSLSFALMLAWLTFLLFGLFLPWLELLGGGHGSASALAYLAGRPFCHQIPGRSFCLAGAPLALCARCTGLLLGLWLGWLTAGILKGTTTVQAESRFILLAAVLPLVIDGLLNYFGLVNSPNEWRGATGLLAGGALGAGLLPAWNQMLCLLRPDWPSRNQVRRESNRGWTRMDADEKNEHSSRRAVKAVEGFAFIGFNLRDRRESEPIADNGQ